MNKAPFLPMLVTTASTATIIPDNARGSSRSILESNKGGVMTSDDKLPALRPVRIQSLHQLKKSTSTSYHPRQQRRVVKASKKQRGGTRELCWNRLPTTFEEPSSSGFFEDKKTTYEVETSTRRTLARELSRRNDMSPQQPKRKTSLIISDALEVGLDLEDKYFDGDSDTE